MQDLIAHVKKLIRQTGFSGSLKVKKKTLLGFLKHRQRFTFHKKQMLRLCDLNLEIRHERHELRRASAGFQQLSFSGQTSRGPAGLN